MTDPDGGRFTYAYDSVNRIKEVVNPQRERATYGYDPAGRRTVKKLANGTRASFSYDAAGNLTRLANLKSDGTTISSFDYDYDKVGNRTAVLEADGSRVTWSYDATYQLTGEHRTGSNAYRDTYTYDPAGNRLLKIHDGARTSYSYDAANQIIYSEDASGRTTYTFDADGNQEVVEQPSGDRTTYAWDYENRMTSAQLPSGVRNTMAYEPDGLRVKLEESTGTKKFVWDGQNYLAETDENDDTQVVYTNEPRMYGNLVSQRRDTEAHYFHFDAIGSTRELTDSNETTTAQRLYDAWGRRLVTLGTTESSFGFSGAHGYFTNKVYGQMYVRARAYHPGQGQWLSIDPLCDVTSVLLDAVANCYTFVLNNPLNLTDASGLITLDDCSTNTECEDALVACMENCLSKHFWILPRSRCYNDCGIRYIAALDRAADEGLTSHLIAECCAGLPTPVQKGKCETEVTEIIGALGKARDRISEGGGPARFSYFGQVCTACQQHVEDEIDKVIGAVDDYFDYTGTGYDTSWPVGDHMWGIINCKRTGKTVAAIDFWCGGQWYWAPGKDGFGWTSNF